VGFIFDWIGGWNLQQIKRCLTQRRSQHGKLKVTSDRWHENKSGLPLPAARFSFWSSGRIRAMKNKRAFLMSLLLAAGMSVFSGCATTGHDSYAATNDSSGFEKKQPSPTEDMTAIQKTGYYLGWYSLAGLYVWAGGGVPISPP
jgi:hypothetical protein